MRQIWCLRSHLAAMAQEFQFERLLDNPSGLTGEVIATRGRPSPARISPLPSQGPTAYSSGLWRLSAAPVRRSRPAHSSGGSASIDFNSRRTLSIFLSGIIAWLSPETRYCANGPERCCTFPRGDAGWTFTTELTPSHYTVPLDPEFLWRNQTSVRIAGSELPSLQPEALLLLLAVHGAKHCWESIGWLVDLAWLLTNQSNLDWQTGDGISLTKV